MLSSPEENSSKSEQAGKKGDNKQATIFCTAEITQKKDGWGNLHQSSKIRKIAWPRKANSQTEVQPRSNNSPQEQNSDGDSTPHYNRYQGRKRGSKAKQEATNSRKTKKSGIFHKKRAKTEENNEAIQIVKHRHHQGPTRVLKYDIHAAALRSREIRRRIRATFGYSACTAITEAYKAASQAPRNTMKHREVEKTSNITCSRHNQHHRGENGSTFIDSDTSDNNAKKEAGERNTLTMGGTSLWGQSNPTSVDLEEDDRSSISSINWRGEGKEDTESSKQELLPIEDTTENPSGNKTTTDTERKREAETRSGTELISRTDPETSKSKAIEDKPALTTEETDKAQEKANENHEDKNNENIFLCQCGFGPTADAKNIASHIRRYGRDCRLAGRLALHKQSTQASKQTGGGTGTTKTQSGELTEGKKRKKEATDGQFLITKYVRSATCAAEDEDTRNKNRSTEEDHAKQNKEEKAPTYSSPRNYVMLNDQKREEEDPPCQQLCSAPRYVPSTRLKRRHDEADITDDDEATKFGNHSLINSETSATSTNQEKSIQYKQATKRVRITDPLTSEPRAISSQVTKHQKQGWIELIQHTNEHTLQKEGAILGDNGNLDRAYYQQMGIRLAKEYEEPDIRHMPNPLYPGLPPGLPAPPIITSYDEFNGNPGNEHIGQRVGPRGAGYRTKKGKEARGKSFQFSNYKLGGLWTFTLRIATLQTEVNESKNKNRDQAKEAAVIPLTISPDTAEQRAIHTLKAQTGIQMIHSAFRDGTCFWASLAKAIGMKATEQNHFNIWLAVNLHGNYRFRQDTHHTGSDNRIDTCEAGFFEESIEFLTRSGWSTEAVGKSLAVRTKIKGLPAGQRLAQWNTGTHPIIC